MHFTITIQQISRVPVADVVTVYVNFVNCLNLIRIVTTPFAEKMFSGVFPVVSLFLFLFLHSSLNLTVMEVVAILSYI